MNKTLAIALVALLVGGGVGYLIHAPKTASGQTASARFARGSFGAAGAGGTFMRGGAGFLTGTVAAKDATSLTIDTRDGSSHLVLLSPSTTVAKSVPGSLSDITVGSQVMVTGSTTSDGSVTATMVNLR